MRLRSVSTKCTSHGMSVARDSAVLQPRLLVPCLDSMLQPPISQAMSASMASSKGSSSNEQSLGRGAYYHCYYYYYYYYYSCCCCCCRCNTRKNSSRRSRAVTDPSHTNQLEPTEGEPSLLNKASYAPIAPKQSLTGSPSLGSDGLNNHSNNSKPALYHPKSL